MAIHLPPETLTQSLLFDDLILMAPQLSKPWLHAAFITLLVGYGTKMGLAPMHTWKPDAYGEAPGIVGAILAGGVTSGAFLAIVRFTMIMHAANEFLFAGRLLIGIGLFSMTIAAIFLVRQRDYKRMLAYSSIEHMGILVIGLGMGGIGIFGALMHLINNAMTKGLLFMSSGNIHRAYGSKLTNDVKGALIRMPISAALFLAGFIAITGSPPFAPFVSEFTILQAIFENRNYGAAALFLIMLLLIFIGLGSSVLPMVQGLPPKSEKANKYYDSFSTVFPLFILLFLVVLLGVYLPPPLAQLLRGAAAFVENNR
jgi:hydrogenase-4 component F